MNAAPQPLSRPLRFHSASLGLALLCSAWALFGGGAGHRFERDRVPYSPANDCLTHMEMVAAAGEAQRGGGSLRVAPRLSGQAVTNYPVFQFYSFLPYHLPALSLRFGLGPYHALLLGCFLSFVLGSVGVAGLSRALGFSTPASLLASAAFCLAPYHLTDLYGRFAYSEVFAFGVLPWVVWSAWLAATRPGLGALLANAAAWAALILSHNIFHVWAVPLLVLWLALQRWVRGPSVQLLRPASAYLLGLALGAFFFAPVVTLGSQFSVTTKILDLASVSAWVLFNPLFARTAYVQHNTPLLGLQIGWIFLLPCALLLWKGAAKSRASLALFVLCALLAWAPFRFWEHLGPFQVIQFPYRLLVFTTLFGSLLLAQWSEGRVGLQGLFIGVFLLGLWSLPWKREVPNRPVASVETDYAQRGVDFRVGLDYQLSSESLAAHSGQELAIPAPKGRRIAVLPQLWYPQLYEVRVDGMPSPYGRAGANLAVDVPMEAHAVEARFTGLAWANRLSTAAAALWLALGAFWLFQVLGIKKRRA